MMFGNYDFLEQMEERRMNRSRESELINRIERESYNEYLRGQTNGLREGEIIGYEKGKEDGRKRGIDICIQILEKQARKPKELAEEFGVSVDVVNKLQSFLNNKKI